MAMRLSDPGRQNQRDEARRNAPAPQVRSADALTGGLPGIETLLAMAVLTDSGRLGELLGLPLPQDSTASGPGPKARPGEAGRLTFVDVLRCRVTWRLVAELFSTASEQDFPEGAARRRPRCHRRQIAMYLSHVVLSVPYHTIAAAFGRDRTTVMHACSVIEDRRDDAAYDRFVERCERCIAAVFSPMGHDDAEL